MTDEALVPREAGALVVPTRNGLLGGCEDFSATDLKLYSEARVSREGKWKINREELAEFRVVLLRVSRFRKLNEGSGADTRTICASTTGLLPQLDVAQPKAKRCAERTGHGLEPVCPFAKWDQAPDGSWIKPSCDEGLAFLGLRLGNGNQPVWIPLTKTARQEGDSLLQLLHGVPGAQHLRQFVVTCRVKQRRGKGTLWHVPDFVPEEGLLPLEQYAMQAEAVADMRYIPRVSAGSRASEIEGQEIDITPTDDENAIPF